VCVRVSVLLNNVACIKTHTFSLKGVLDI
jgi:hypothetical protein